MPLLGRSFHDPTAAAHGRVSTAAAALGVLALLAVHVRTAGATVGVGTAGSSMVEGMARGSAGPRPAERTGGAVSHHDERIGKAGPDATATMAIQPAALYPLSAADGDYDTEVALLALQGLANRDAADGPTLWLNASDKFWPFPAAGDEWRNYLAERHSVAFQPLAATHAGAPLCDVLGSPVVSAAAQLAGMVVYNSSQDGARFVAVTQAGIDRLLPVTAAVIAAHRAAGCLSSLPVVANVSFAEDDAAYAYMLQSLVPRANHSAAVAACHPHTNYSCGWGDPVGALSIDYAVSVSGIVFNLSPSQSDAPQQAARFTQLVSTLDPLSPVLGWAEPEVDYASRVGAAGAVVLCGAPNLSFLRRVGLSRGAAACHLPSSPGTAPLDRSKHYVTFQTNEGDTAKNAYSLRGGNWISPSRGYIPISWGTNPMIAKLFPVMWQYQCDGAVPGMDTFFAAVAGAGYTHVFSMPDAARAAYESRAGELMSQYGPTGVDVWVTWRGNDTMAAFEEYQQRAKAAGSPIQVFTMQPTLPTDGAVNMWLSDGTPVFAAAKALWYPQLNKTDPASDLEARIVAAAAATPPPSFLLVYGAPDYVNLALDMSKRLDSEKFSIVGQDEMARLGRLAAPQLLRTQAAPSAAEPVQNWHADGSNGVSVDVNYTIGGGIEYAVSALGSPWFVSAPVGIQANGKWWSSDADLIVASASGSSGSDALGAFSRLELTWEGQSSGAAGETIAFATAFRVYSSLATDAVRRASGIAADPDSRGGAVVFEQSFPDGVGGCALGPAWDEAAQASSMSAFPAFTVSGPAAPNRRLGFLAPTGCCSHEIGEFPAHFEGNMFAGTPLGLFSDEMDVAWVLSPLNHAVTSSQVLHEGATQHAEASTELRAGLLGTIASVPANYTYETVLYGATKSGSVNQAYNGFGALLLAYAGKKRTAANASVVTSKLGYSTTSGYFYAPIIGESYEDTILAVAEYADKEMLPYNYYLLDSWWYGEYWHNGSGVLRWDESAAVEADPASPMGRFPHGLAWLSETLNQRYPALRPGRFVQHNGKWRADSPYVKNESWQFVVNNTGNPDTSASLSRSPEFWKWLADTAVAWGLDTMKQDHTQQQIPQIPECLTTVDFCEDYLQAQGDALAAAGAHLQAGGYTQRGWLHSVNLAAATHARVAADIYQWHEVGKGNYFAYDVAPNGMLSWAVGLLPYKDAWYSTSTEVQTSNFSTGFKGWKEPYPYTHAVASALSGGPIAPGDLVNGSNASLILRTCMSDGTLLKPDRPCTPIDSYWRNAALDTAGPNGEVWATSTSIPLGDSSALTWHFAVSIGLNTSYSLGPPELIGNNAVWSTAAGQSDAKFFAFEDAQTGGGAASARPFDDSHPIEFAPGPDYGAIHLWTAAPTIDGLGWTLLGETSKLIAVSRQRIERISVSPTDGDKLHVALRGAPAEVVELSFIDDGDRVVRGSCTISGSGESILSMPSGKCT